VMNDPRTNGEYWLLDRVVRDARKGDRVLDVGANRGNWSLEAIRLGALERGCVIEAFEPSATTRRVLASRVGTHVAIHAIALSDTNETVDFYEQGDCAGTNSLAAIAGAMRCQVTTARLDALVNSTPEAAIKMVKVDTEGFDLLVLRGATSLLQRGLIEVVQFEYNWRWLQNHLALRDAFELIAQYPYRLGKLIGSRIEFYDEWHPELERFFESNFVLVRQGSSLEHLGVGVTFDVANLPVRRR
jgi:FkbM family methyltransferase